MTMRLTKTFLEVRRYKRVAVTPGSWELLPPSNPADVHPPIDAQVNAWVRETGNLIVHPGQLSMFAYWEDREMSVKCVNIGLTVLYVQNPSTLTAADAQASAASGDNDYARFAEAGLAGAAPPAVSQQRMTCRTGVVVPVGSGESAKRAEIAAKDATRKLIFDIG